MVPAIRHGESVCVPAPTQSGRGWPWQDKAEAPEPLPAGSARCPRISVVTPSYNQGQYLERSLRSVLLQGYPDLELIVMDGGSSDNSVDIIRHYEGQLAHWQSERDDGQSGAINRGMERATGEIVAWLNCDDYYLPGTLAAVAESWCGEPRPQWVTATCRFDDHEGRLLHDWVPTPPSELAVALSRSASVPQPSSFWSRDLWTRVGGLNEQLHYCMDEDLWMRFYVAGARPVVLPRTLAVAQQQDQSKGALFPSRFARDFARVVRLHRRHVPAADRGLWRKGAFGMAEDCGIKGWMSLERRDPRSAGMFFTAGMRLSCRGVCWGALRRFGAAGSGRLRTVHGAPGGQSSVE